MENSIERHLTKLLEDVGGPSLGLKEDSLKKKNETLSNYRKKMQMLYLKEISQKSLPYLQKSLQPTSYLMVKY